MSTCAIDTEGLCLYYKRKLALDHLSLRLPSGAIHAFIGANGAGKSSLFRVLLGFESPSAGQARILGHDCTALTPEVRGRIGFVNENHTLPPWMQVCDIGRMQQRQYVRWDSARYDHVLSHFNVLPEQKVRELSRGERAGLNLALVLAQRPELLILDEPTLGLDVVAKSVFLEAMLEAADTDRTTIVYCSHQMDEIERVADSLVILEKGRLRYAGEPDEFCKRVRLWIADFPSRMPEIARQAGVLQVQWIEGAAHIAVYDRDDDFGAALKSLGARSAQAMPLGLDRAVNAFLAQNHIGMRQAA